MKIKYNSDIIDVPYYKEYFVQKYSDEQILKYAEMIVNGELTFGYDNLEAVNFDLSKINRYDWNRVIGGNSNTFYLYLFGLRHIYLLSSAYLLDKNYEYLRICNEFIISELKYYNTNDINKMFYNDHAMAERVENIVFFISVCMKKNVDIYKEKEIIRFLELTLSNLISDQFYQRNHNHGIIVDKAALIGMSFLKEKDEKNMEKVIARLNEQVNYGYGPDGVHVENSIDYHHSISYTLLGAAYILDKIEHPFAEDLFNIVEKAKRYIIYSLKPNKFRPLFGDSKGFEDENKDIDFSTLSNEYLLYIKTNGTEGEKPTELSSYFYSGYAFFRETFDKEKLKDSTWLSFKAGYKSRIHKHQDDLSISLYSKGYDIFVDSGMYNFMADNPIKRYMDSIAAHTTIGVKGKEASISSGNGEKTKILEFKKYKNYEHVSAYSKLYENVVIYRNIYYLREENLIIINDDIISNILNEYVQYFNLSNYVTIESASEQRVVLKIENSNNYVDIQQLTSDVYYEIIDGGKPEVLCLNSKGFGRFKESKTIEYIKTGRTTEFVTVIEILEGGYTKNRKVTLKDDNVIIDNDVVVELKKYRPIEFKGVDILYRKGKVVISNKRNILFDSSYKYSVYIYSFKEQKFVEKINYTNYEEIEFNLPNDGVYHVLYYIQNSFREMSKGIVAIFEVENGKFISIKKYEELHSPKNIKSKMDVLSSGERKFVIEIEYDFNSSFSWWVYKDGVNIKFEQNENNCFIFDYYEKGRYVVMCSVRDRIFGEYHFKQFDVVEIN